MTGPLIESAYTVLDLMRLTGFGRDKTKRLMREGRLPGIVDGRTYTCPRAMYDAWVQRLAQSRPQHDAPAITMLHRVERRAS